MRKTSWIILILVLAIGGIYFWQYANHKTTNRQLASASPTPVVSPTPANTPTPTASPNVQLANPASKYCVEQGGKVVMKKLPNGGEYGVCDFGDARFCEEWALFRGECPKGGIKIAGYDNEAQRYCAITGGEVDMVKDTCTKNGKVCNIEAYYNGSCSLATSKDRTYIDKDSGFTIVIPSSWDKSRYTIEITQDNNNNKMIYVYYLPQNGDPKAILAIFTFYKKPASSAKIESMPNHKVVLQNNDFIVAYSQALDIPFKSGTKDFETYAKMASSVKELLQTLRFSNHF